MAVDLIQHGLSRAGVFQLERGGVLIELLDRGFLPLGEISVLLRETRREFRH